MANGSSKRLAAAWSCLVIVVASTGLAHASEVAWHRIPQAAQEEAQQSGRPLLVYIGADFCGYCRKLERTTWADDRVNRTIEGGFVPLHLDGQRDAELAHKLGVQSFPAVIVVSPAGEIVGRVNGYREPAEMQAFLVRHGVFRERAQFGGR